MNHLFARTAAVAAAAVPIAAAAVPGAAPATAAIVHADAPEGRVQTLPGSIDLSTLEGCTAHFGLTKLNSQPVVFDETVTGPLSPAPLLGDGLTPVATFTFDDASTYTCILEPAWSDQAGFETFFDISDFDGADFDGFERVTSTPVYLVPGRGVGITHYFRVVGAPLSAGLEIPDVAIEIVVDPAFAADFSVTHTEDLDVGTPLDSETAQSDPLSYVTVISDAIRDRLPESVRSAFDAVRTSGFCTDTDDVALEAAVASIVVRDGDDPTDLCRLLESLFYSQVFDIQIADNVADILVASEAPEPPETTDGSGPSSSIPATGSDDAGHMALTAGLMAAVGAALVALSRRRRAI